MKKINEDLRGQPNQIQDVKFMNTNNKEEKNNSRGARGVNVTKKMKKKNRQVGPIT